MFLVLSSVSLVQYSQYDVGLLFELRTITYHLIKEYTLCRIQRTIGSLNSQLILVESWLREFSENDEPIRDFKEKESSELYKLHPLMSYRFDPFLRFPAFLLSVCGER